MAKRRANGEGSLYKRKDGLWCAQYTDNGGKARYLYGKTQQIVKEKLKEAIRYTDRGLSVDGGNTLFSAWMGEWLEVYARPTIRQNTYARYYNHIHNHIIPYFGNVKLKDLREDMLQKFLNEKAERRLDGKPGGYCQNVCSDLKVRMYCALEKAVDLDMILKNPARNLRVGPAVRKEKKILTIEQQKTFENAVRESMKEDMNNAIYLLMLYTGLRVGEATGLKLEDVNLAKRELYVRRTVGRVRLASGISPVMESEPKTAASRRTVPVAAPLAALLEQVIASRKELIEIMRDVWADNGLHNEKWINGGYLFLIPIHGNVLEPKQVAKRQNKIMQKIGLDHVSPHALRHTFATRWLENGYDVRSLADILGHTDAKMTLNTYAHSLPEQKKKSMDDFMRGF